MNRKMIMTTAAFLASAGVAFAAEGVDKSFFFGTGQMAAIIGLGIAAGPSGVGMGILVAAALQGMARQPELISKLQTNMIIGLAFIETVVLYTLLLAIIVLFANPFAKHIVGVE
jgi:F-type H+-transporting ATPase subunit c